MIFSEGHQFVSGDSAIALNPGLTGMTPFCGGAVTSDITGEARSKETMTGLGRAPGEGGYAPDRTRAWSCRLH
jgi:hypothetical protein